MNALQAGESAMWGGASQSYHLLSPDRGWLQVFCTCPRSENTRISLARLQRICPPKRSRLLRVRAVDNIKNEPTVDVRKLGVIPFNDDSETLGQAMAFTGPAPEVGCLQAMQQRAIMLEIVSQRLAPTLRLIRCTCVLIRSRPGSSDSYKL